MNDNADRFITITTFVSPLEAEASQLGLEAEGIPAMLQDANTIQMDPLLGVAIGDVKLQVPQSQAGLAIDLLEQIRTKRIERSKLRDDAPTKDRCLACDAEMPENQEACPNCGWSWMVNQHIRRGP